MPKKTPSTHEKIASPSAIEAICSMHIRQRALVRHNVISEEVDLLQGRISKSVFVRHYLKENPAELRDRVMTALTQLEQTLSL